VEWSPIESTQHCDHQCPIVLAPDEYDDGEIGVMIGRGNRSTRRKPAQMTLCPPQIPHACPDSNPGRRGRNPASNRLNYGKGRVRIWLKHYSTSRKVAGSSPVEVDLSIHLILPAALQSWHLISLYQKWVPGIFLGVKCGWRLGLTILPPSMSRLFMQNVGASTSHNHMGLHGLLQGSL
jgi:hypothetical protein